MTGTTLEDKFDVELEFAKLIHERLGKDELIVEHMLKAVEYFEARQHYLMAAEIAEYVADGTKEDSLYERAIRNYKLCDGGEGERVEAMAIYEIRKKQTRLI
ncbi:MAG: hypothetical protein AABX27_02490 [Nanoarchaeota archaeon]